jgi:hypothetical protein
MNRATRGVFPSFIPSRFPRSWENTRSEISVSCLRYVPIHSHAFTRVGHSRRFSILHVIRPPTGRLNETRRRLTRHIHDTHKWDGLHTRGTYSRRSAQTRTNTSKQRGNTMPRRSSSCSRSIPVHENTYKCEGRTNPGKLPLIVIPSSISTTSLVLLV